jgi:murein L,D-transpeptidase YafK
MTNKTLVLYIVLIAWAVAFFGLGMVCAKAENWVTSPSKMYMPGNIYNTAIINSTNTANTTSDSKFNNCKNPGTVVKVVVDKSDKTMQLLDVNGCVVKQYNVVTGKNPGPKQCDGDKKTPEGTYKIIEKRDSKYHKFLALDYPRAKDIKKAKELGCKPGDSIGIHSWIEGLPIDGSLGCIRVKTKEEILEVNRLVRVGTEVEIKE